MVEWEALVGPVRQCEAEEWPIVAVPILPPDGVERVAVAVLVQRCEALDSTVVAAPEIRVAKVWRCEAEEWPITAVPILPPDGVERVAVAVLVQPWDVTY